MRQSRSLAGSWQFQLDPTGTLTAATLAPDRQITVPMPWQAAFPDLQAYSGYAWYRHTFALDQTWLGGEVLITFGAVDYWCEVFINGQRVGEHEGGYLPFTFAIGAHVHAGDNRIVVRVYDSAQNGITYPRWPDQQPVNQLNADQRFNAVDVPHGKQEWYLNVGGIWQDVTLTAVGRAWVDHAAITPDVHTGSASIAITLAGAVHAGDRLITAIGDVQTETALTADQTGAHVTLTINRPALWSPESPTLYTASIRVQTADQEIDRYETRFGFREIVTKNGELLLNGQPLYLLGVLDQDLYPDTIYTVPSDAYLRDQFEKVRQLGINCLRVHIKPPDPRYLDLADELGLLVWAEIPSWRTFYPRTTLRPADLDVPSVIRARVENTLSELIRRDFNHPSIIIWTLVNEDWGTFLPYSPSDRAWIANLYDRCKQLDPTRLVVDNSPCPSYWGPNVHTKSDLDDFHTYRNIPDQAADWLHFTEQFALHPLWTYSSYGDAQRTGHEPLILSEFGNWGLPSLKAISPADGREPHWFTLGPWWSMWGGEPGWPQNVVKRFAALGLDKIWPDYEAFAAATQWHQFAALKFEIESMRRQPTISGYVITELTDAYWESNGLLDFARQPKVFHDRLASINTLDVVIPHVSHYAGWSGESIPLGIDLSRYSDRDWSHAALTWGREGEPTATLSIGQIKRGQVVSLKAQTITLPEVDRAQTIRVNFNVADRSGQALAHNTLDILTLPQSAQKAAYPGSVAVIAAHESNSRRGLAYALKNLGYATLNKIDAKADLLVTNYPTAKILQWVREGGSLLYLSSGDGPFFWREGRGGTYSGSWITSFNWLRPGIYKRLPTDNPTLMPFATTPPTGVILGLPLYDAASQGDVLAGQVTGWAHHPAAHTVQFRYGRGKVIMTTYALRTALERSTPDPIAIAMLHDLVDHLTSAACQPVLSANY